MRSLGPALVLGAGLLAGAAPATAADPPATLAERETRILTRDAVEEVFEERPREVDCRRRSRLRLTCRTATRIGRFERVRARVTVRRSGTRLSPIDRYDLRATRIRELTGTRRTQRADGRFVVESRRAPAGRTLRLLGRRGVEIEVTAAPPVDPYVSPDPLELPEAGTRFVAIPMNIRNVGRATFDAPFGPDVDLLLSDGSRGDSRHLGEGCPTAVELAPGRLRRGVCRTFQIPSGVRVERIDLDVGRETGRWAVTRDRARRNPAP